MPCEAELKEFEQLSRLKRIKVLKDNKGNYVDLEPGEGSTCWLQQHHLEMLLRGTPQVG